MDRLIGCVTFVTVLLAAASPALATCDEALAVTGLQQCKDQIHQIDKNIFNASNADHKEQLCCSAVAQFEDCIRTAIRHANCHHEVDYLVTLLMSKARDMLGQIYDANCWYDCRTAAASAFCASTGLVVLALVALWGT
uniref:Putative secreted salivary protein n=1 Tax=Amblyomma triste TaxID=251400 RepID=A0A023G268_AMBTT